MGLVGGCPENVRAPTIYSAIGRKLSYYVVHRYTRSHCPDSHPACTYDLDYARFRPNRAESVDRAPPTRICDQIGASTCFGCRIGTWHENRERRGARRLGGICRARSHIRAPSPCVSTAGTSLGSEAPRHPSSRGLEPSAPPAAQVWVPHPTRNPVFRGRAYLRSDAALRTTGFPVRRRVRGESGR
jgi:hypothetical protein